MRIIQISDTHLSHGKSQFIDNWRPLAAWIAAEHPDLVIHTGDVTVDGAEVEEDLRYAAGLIRRLGIRFRAVPGNHDVGDPGHPRQPVTDERLSRWQAHFGSDRWIEDIEDFRLIGIDAMLFGSGHAEEAVQAAWLETAMENAQGRGIAWFLHKPLFLDSADEGETGYWSVKPRSRGRLVEFIRLYSVRLVASGHLHKAHQLGSEGCRYVWAPASSFLVGPEIQPPMPGEKRLGAVRYQLDGKALQADIRCSGASTALDRRCHRRGLSAADVGVPGARVKFFFVSMPMSEHPAANDSKEQCDGGNPWSRRNPLADVVSAE